MTEQAELARKKEDKEVPFDFLVVIADDEPASAQSTRQAAEIALKGDNPSEEKNRVRVVESINELFEIALEGNDGKQADVVLLDDAYIYNYGQ